MPIFPIVSKVRLPRKRAVRDLLDRFLIVICPVFGCHAKARALGVIRDGVTRTCMKVEAKKKTKLTAQS
jgi:hypothetical protein